MCSFSPPLGISDRGCWPQDGRVLHQPRHRGQVRGRGSQVATTWQPFAFLPNSFISTKKYRYSMTSSRLDMDQWKEMIEDLGFFC
jgi:hypothetical protein